MQEFDSNLYFITADYDKSVDFFEYLRSSNFKYLIYKL